MTRRAYLCLLIGAGVWATVALSQEEPDLRPTLTIERQDKTIRVIQNGRGADGARFIPSNPRCEENIRLGIAHAPDPGFVETLLNQARIVSAIALLKRPTDAEDQETLELFGGNLSFTDERCPGEVERSDIADVVLTEGRTTITGSSFNYDNATGLGTMDGPVQLERTAEGDSEALAATADALEIDVDEDATLLSGNVRITSGERVSEAEVVEYDEAAGFAILRGNPAVSRLGSDEVQGNIIEYDLNTNDVVARERIRASFEYDR